MSQHGLVATHKLGSATVSWKTPKETIMKHFWKEKDMVAVHGDTDGIVFWITFQSFVREKLSLLKFELFSS